MINLFSGYKLKNFNIRNRIVLPPLVRFSLIGTDGFVTDELVKWYEDIAIGGVGMIIVEASCVCINGKLRDNQLGIWSDEFIPGLSKIAEIGNKYNIPIIIQIHHAGFFQEISKVHESVLDDILEKFVNSFYRAKKAGFHGIEIHGAHTYLISQLNSKIWNTRNDKYGGSFKNRMFFSRELIKKTRSLFDDNFILSYRMGGNEPTLLDGIAIAKELESYGVDILHVSSGVPDPLFMQEVKVHIPYAFPYDWVVFLGVEIKKHVNIPVIGVRRIKKEVDASWLIENNHLDFIAIGRGMIARSNWARWAADEYNKRTGNRIHLDY